jgi:hypothetical protein
MPEETGLNLRPPFLSRAQRRAVGRTVSDFPVPVGEAV